jgi:hypothetical protein
MITWIIRILAFLMLWGGLNGILGPILTVLDSIPIIGGAGRFVISLATGAIAFTLWLLTLIVSNLWLVLAITAVLGVAAFVYLKKRQGMTPATT